MRKKYILMFLIGHITARYSVVLPLKNIRISTTWSIGLCMTSSTKTKSEEIPWFFKVVNNQSINSILWDFFWRTNNKYLIRYRTQYDYNSFFSSLSSLNRHRSGANKKKLKNNKHFRSSELESIYCSDIPLWTRGRRRKKNIAIRHKKAKIAKNDEETRKKKEHIVSKTNTCSY